MTIHLIKDGGQQLVRVVYDYYPAVGQTQVMTLRNDYTGEKYTIDLGMNFSTITYRMGEYLVDGTDIDPLPEGLYTYTIKDASTSGCDGCSALSRGVVKVLRESPDEVLEARKPVEYKDPTDNEGWITYEED